MNKRIKKLAEQSGLSDFFAPNQTQREKDLNNFAELIIRECMQVSMKSVGVDAEHEAWYLIKEHFGIK